MLFFFNDTATTEIYTLSLHDALPIFDLSPVGQIFGLGPQVALVSSYSSQPIVSEIKRTATGFPLARSLEIKNSDKTSVEKDRKSTRLNSSHLVISYAVFCLQKKSFHD